MNSFLRDEKNDLGGDEGSGGAPGAADSSSNEGEGFDDFGYPIVKEAAAPPASGEQKPPEQKAPDAAAPDSVTGYGDEPPAAPVVADPPPAEAEKIELGYELKTDGLDAADATELKKFFKAEGFTEKQANAMVARRSAEVKAANDAKVAAENAVLEQQKVQRATWHKELKTDPTFGGEKFAHNVAQATKVVEEFMPQTKKILTERKTMLPPYVMRDLAKLAETLFASPSLVQGSAVVPPKEEGPDSHLDFYGLKQG